MASPTNLRASPRSRLVAPIEVSWQDAQGIEWRRQGYSLDTSSGGLKMELPTPVPLNTRINIRSAQFHFAGSASVRHCRREGPRYVVGVAFHKASPAVLRPEPVAESQTLSGESETDEVTLFFQDLKVRRSRRVVSRRSRRRVWLRVAFIVWASVSVLFMLSLPRLLRLASETFPHPLLERALAFVESVTRRGPSTP